MDTELAQLQWSTKERLLSIHEAKEELAIQLLALEEEHKAWELEQMSYQFEF